MADDWAVRFRHFSLSVDNVDDEAFEHTKQLVADYLVSTLGACYYEVLLDGMWVQDGAGESPALSTSWSSREGNQITIGILGPDSQCSALTAYAYLKRRPLWITAQNKERLEEARRGSVALVDAWSGLGGIPPYRDYGESVAKTSIVVPLEYGARVFGVLNLEFEDHLPITENGKETVRILGNSLARVIWLHQTFSTTTADTLRAFDALERLPTTVASPLKRRMVFLSSSSQADEAVVKVLRSVLEEFDELFEVKFWREESLSGNIKQQVRDALVAAEFGVCYLSERNDAEGAEHPFEDNVNVIFEAGMLQAVHELRKDNVTLSRWIPVREMPPHTTPPPFDFATDRIVTVPRDEKTLQLDEAEFANRVRAAVESQVESLGLK